MSAASLLPRHHVIIDAEQGELAHTRLDCPAHVGLIDLVESHLGESCDDPATVLDVAGRLGLVVVAEVAEHARPCPSCTLVAAPFWRAAA
jgi:hypothetical protein